MTLEQLGDYLRDPAKDGNPAVEAARILVEERHRLIAAVAERIGPALQTELYRREIAELRAAVASYRKENERLRRLVNELTPAPWEAA